MLVIHEYIRNTGISRLTQISLCPGLLEFHVDLKSPTKRAVNTEGALLQVAVHQYVVYLLRGEMVEGTRVVKHHHLEVGCGARERERERESREKRGERQRERERERERERVETRESGKYT